MQSAALFLLASSMGVLFGWQPMPDGSPRYEYVVQLDPDLLATLEAGGSIPISSDIPEDIGPIGRIRIVVGREPLPRTRLTTTLKPSLKKSRTGKKSRAGLLETQHRVAPVESTAVGRYNNAAPQTILPPSDANPSAILPPQSTQGLAGSLQEATQSLGNQLRNVGESVRTDAQQMFGRARNDASAGITGQIGKTVEQLQQGVQEKFQQGFQQGAEPFRQAAQQTGQHLRNAAENLGQQARETLDQFGRPLGERSILGGRKLGARENQPQTILPPSSSPPPQQQFTGNPSGAHGHQHDQPVSSRRDNWEASPWNNPALPTSGNTTPGGNPPPTLSSSPPAQTTTTNPRAFNTPWPAHPQNKYPNQASQRPQQSTQPQIFPNKIPNDRFDLANPSIDRRVSGPSFPTDDFPANDRHSHASSAPEIRRDMLQRPADAALLTAGGQPAPPVFSQSSGGRSSERPSQANDFSWDHTRRRADGNLPPRSEDPTRAVFPLLLSWVLLSGSGAGNLYLLWSFWDVRNKYRGLVHNARSGGGRYSGN